jgi:phosphoglycolate phosphatase
VAAGKLVIFDYGGTIVDSKGVFFSALNGALSDAGLPRLKSPEEFVSLFSGNFYEGLKEKYPRLKNEGILLKKVVSGFKANQVKEEDSLPLVPGITRALRKLKDSGATLAIVTAASAENVMKVLMARGLSNLFSFVLGSEAGQSKTEKIARVMEKHPFPKEAVYYVGDTSGDVIEAKECGIKTVGVLWGYHKEADFAKAKPDILIDKPEELSDAVS